MIQTVGSAIGQRTRKRHQDNQSDNRDNDDDDDHFWIAEALASNDNRGKRFDPLRALDDACKLIRASAGTGDKYRTVRREPFIIGCLVRDGFLKEEIAWHAVKAAVAGLEKHADDIDHMWNATEGAFAEGLGASPRRAGR